MASGVLPTFCDDFLRAVHLADAAAEFALLLVRRLAADVLAEVVVGARVILPAEEDELAGDRRIDLLPRGDRAALGPDLAQLLDRRFP